MPGRTPQIGTPQVEGTPLDSTSFGSEVSSNSEKASATTAPPRPQTAAPSLQQAQAPQRSGSLAAAQPQKESPAEDETQPQFEPSLPPTPKEAANRLNAGEMFAMPLGLPGGRLGGGFDTPTNDPAILPHDETAAFRARLSSCSHLPTGIDENVAIEVRISFKRDGTLASQPQLLKASLSPDAAFLMQSAVDAPQSAGRLLSFRRTNMEGGRRSI